jgi:thioredoxin 1
VGNAQVFTGENFESEVLKASIPVLVDFTATWCGPCQRLAPIIEELASSYAGRVKVGKVDIDANQDLAISYGIMSVPTVIAFHAGKPVETMVGLNPKSYYTGKLDALTGKAG